MLQIKHGQPCENVTNIFKQTTEDYNFRQNQDFKISSVNTVYYGPESTYHKIVVAGFASNLNS